MIPERFRDSYDGEFVITGTVWKNGSKTQTREWIANPIVNQHISGRAAVIGTDPSARPDVVKRLEKHKGGLLGKKKLQTYGVNDIWKIIRCDFCVDNDREDLQQIIDNNINDNTVFYTTVRNCLIFPGQFYVIPYGVRLCPAAQAAYLAAFDGHKEIYFVGVDGIKSNGSPDPQIVADVAQVLEAYRGVKFYFVTDGAAPAAAWRKYPNVSVWDYRKFISYCDV